MHRIRSTTLALSALLFAGVSIADEAAATKEPIAAEAERPWRPPTLTSGLGVPAGETFHLGERPSGDFIVSAYNRGKVPVTILAKRGKRVEEVGVVKPTETVVRAFQSSDGVLVQNNSASTNAKLKVEVWGAKDLAMYYVPNDEEPKPAE